MVRVPPFGIASRALSWIEVHFQCAAVSQNDADVGATSLAIVMSRRRVGSSNCCAMAAVTSIATGTPARLRANDHAIREARRHVASLVCLTQELANLWLRGVREFGIAEDDGKQVLKRA
jgi:hypothetical protein